MMIRGKPTNVPSFFRLNCCLSAVARLALCSALLGMFLSADAMAQSAGLAVGSDSGTPGSSVTVPVGFTPGPTSVSTLQFDLMFSSSLSYVLDPDGNLGTDNLTGPAALAAGKTASANLISGGVRILIFGLNQYAIGSGAVATITLNISASAPAGSVPLTLAGIAASDPTGSINVPISPTYGSVTVVAPSDVTPPFISSVAGSDITSSGATITWTTNEASDTQVEYGTTTGYGSSTTLNTALVTSHSQALSGLASGTLYHYRVKSKDASGNPATSGDYTFTTLDGTAPTISAVSATGITGSGATISWTTNEASDTHVEYGTTTGYGSSTTLNTALVTSHSQALSGLAAGTLYHYRVKSKDASGNPATSGDYTFTTTAEPDKTAPTISSVSSSNISSTSATIKWTTDEASDTQVVYGITTSYGHSTTLGSAMVTSHSQALSGLTPETLYHYQVKSRDAAGNLAESGDYTFTTTAEQDKTAPIISSVSSTNIGSTSATIKWTTDEASDTQVVYGTTTSYGNSTTLESAMVTSHSQALSGLTPETLYHYQVKSRDAAGNLATSGDFTFTTQASSPAPVISEITVSDVTSKSAKISWTTDKPSDSEVEYWAGHSTIRKAAAGTRVTRHSLALNGLRKETSYSFNVKSTDSDRNQAVAPELTFTTKKHGAPALVLPRFALAQDQQAASAETLMGMALANLDSETATLTFTAIESNGNLIEGPDIINPSVLELAPGAQLPTHDFAIFGDGLSTLDSDGWIKLDTDTPDVNGIFMIFDSNVRLLDGANLAEGPITDFVFTEIQTKGRNKISIVNTNLEDTTVTLDLMKANGTVRSSQSQVIKMNGALTADLFNDLFPSIEPDATDYIRVSSDKGVYPFQVMQQQQGDISTLAGQDITTGGTRIFSPQYVVGGPYRTTISVINLDPRAGMIQLRLMGEDGHQIGPTRLLAISANGKLFIDEQMFFLTPDPEVMVTGYVDMISDGVRLAGSTVFGDRKGQSFISALALVSNLQSSVVFSHVASSDLYFTGIAIFNPNTKDATAKLELYAADGTLVERKWESIPAGRRKARLVSEYFSSLAGSSQTSGYIKLMSNRPIASFALFGTWDLSVLSAIPPQVIQ